MPNYFESISQLVNEADLVLEVLDARMPEWSRNELVEKLINKAGKKLVFVLNKSDLVSKKNLDGAKTWLLQFGDCVYVSAISKSEPKKLWGVIFRNLKSINRERRRKWVVGFVGYPNTGKSSLINLLVRKQKAKVSKKAGTTHGIQWVRFGENIKILDSPGVIPLRKGDPIKYGFLGVKEPHRLDDPELIAYEIIKLFLVRSKHHQSGKRSFESFFNIKVSPDDSEDDVFDKIAKSKGYLKRGGLTDEFRTSVAVISAWHQGKITI